VGGGAEVVLAAVERGGFAFLAAGVAASCGSAAASCLASTSTSTHVLGSGVGPPLLQRQLVDGAGRTAAGGIAGRRICCRRMQGSGEEQQGTEQVYAAQAPPTDHASKDSLSPVESPQAEAIRAAPLLLVGLLVLVAVWWDGAFDMRYWAPLTLLALAVLCALTLAGTISLPERGPLAVSLAAIWAFAAYTMLSAAWSESAADAWEGAARTIFYAALFTLAVVAPAGPRGRRWVAAGLVFGVVAIGIATELRLLADGAGAFLAGRLNDPIGYRNGTAALFAFAAWPLVGLAARRGVGSGLRAAAFAALVLMLGLAFLTQSRGLLLGLAGGGAVSLTIGPDRVRRAWLALVAVGVVALGSSSLLGPYHASGSGSGVAEAGDIASAATTLALLCGGSFLVALFAFVFDNGLRPPRLDRGLRAAAALGLVVLVAVAGVVAISRTGDPVSYAEDKWDEFTQVESSGTEGTRLGTVGGPRYDIYRVALDQFGEAPIAGAGEGSYRFAYYRERRTDRNLADAHSLPLRLLAETGLIGAGLFALWLGAIGVAVARRARFAGPGEQAWVAGMAAGATALLIQSTVDWLWLIPALFGLGVLALGLAAREDDEVGLPLAPASRGLAALALALAIVSVGALFLSGLYVRKARREALVSPAAALSSARTAERLNPVSVTPLYLQAAALETEGRRGAARRALLEALELERDNFVTLGLLGDLEVRDGNEVPAHKYYRRALALNPLDTGLQELSERIEGR
jgi:O-antigen ligase/polysaccharide polymerase Wzy-like membrane protein